MSQKHLSLKEEYAAKKAEKLREAKELLEAHFLIVEKLDTTTISRIVDSMNSVEEALSAFLPKLKSIKGGLDAAEAELNNLVSGKAGNDSKKTGAMLGKAMAFYQHLSSFLRQDLPVLLRSRMLAPAKTNPEQPVGPKMIPAFEQALAQEKTGGFLKRLFSSTNIPYVDNKQLAQELSTLSFSELEQLTKIGKTPAVIPQAQLDQAAAQAVGSATPAAPTAPGTAPASVPAPSAPSPEKVAPPGPEKRKEVEDYLKSAISGIMQGSPASAQVAGQIAKKVSEILKT